MVSGDTINIEIACLPETKFFLGSQAETKIFVSHNGDTCKQNIRGNIAEEALAVVVPDAVVPFANSRFIQKQVWHLKETSEFILCDWLHEGRSTRGEHFKFSRYHSETSIYVDNEIRILDRIDIDTERGDPGAIGAFGPYTGVLTMYVVGRKVTEAIRAHVQCSTAHEKVLKRWVTVNSVDKSTLTLRVMSVHKSEITHFVQEIMALLGGKDFLGVNPLRRKH
jgi:urease accessory protein